MLTRQPLVGALVLGAAFLASRLPLLSLGYGSDERAWRSVVTALHMYAVRHYIPSRFPGFPLHDVLTTLLLPLGPLALVLAAVAAQIAGAIVFLSSSAADYVHGVVLPVDNGWAAV